MAGLENQLASAGVSAPAPPTAAFANGSAGGGVTPEDYWSPIVTGAHGWLGGVWCARGKREGDVRSVRSKCLLKRR